MLAQSGLYLSHGTNRRSFALTKPFPKEAEIVFTIASWQSFDVTVVEVRAKD